MTLGMGTNGRSGGGVTKTLICLFWVLYPRWGCSTIKVSLKEEMKENGPFRPHLRVKQLPEKLLFLLLILSYPSARLWCMMPKHFFLLSL